MARDACLSGIIGELAGRIFPLGEKPVILGSSPDADISIPGDASVSGKHARIGVLAGEVYVVDLGSSAGTTVNGKVISNLTALGEGDRLGIGDQAFRVSLPTRQLASVRSQARSAFRTVIGCLGIICVILFLGWFGRSLMSYGTKPEGDPVAAINQWFQENLDDADSVQLVSVFDAPADQQVPGTKAFTVSYRAKNGFGAYRLVRDELMVVRDGRVVKTESPLERERRIQGKQLDKVYEQMYGGTGP